MALDRYAQSTIGSVTQSERRIIEIAISVTDQVIDDHTAEYVITINGRMIKRLSHFSARRLFGLPAN